MHIEKSDSIKELATALAKAQALVKVAVKDKNNPFFKSVYADFGSVSDACRGPLNSNGLSIVQMPVDSDTHGSVALATWLLHESGEYIMGVMSTRIAKDDPQGVGSALTYLRRYALAAFVGVVADEDDDGNAASQPQANGNGKQAERPFDPKTARDAIAALSQVTADDKVRAAKFTDKASLTALYKEIAARKLSEQAA